MRQCNDQINYQPHFKKISKSLQVPEIVSGRRVVELDILARELWCSVCDIALSLRNSLREGRNGLLSEIDVQCDRCFQTYKVNTGKHSSSTTFPDVNLKLAVGTLIELKQLIYFINDANYY